MSLVLKRRPGESIVIVPRVGKLIRVTMGQNTGGETRLVVDAAEEVGVYREEVWERMQQGHMAGE